MASSKHGEVEIAIYAALFGNLIIAITELIEQYQGNSGILNP